jgi:hypothetical protein
MSIYEIVKKLIGSIEPYGDSGIDNKRSINLDEHIELVFGLVTDLIKTADFKNRNEASIQNLGIKANEALLEIKNSIDKNID